MEHPAPSQGPVFSEKETQSIDDASSGTLSVEPAGQNLRAGTLPRLDSLMDQLGLSSRFHGNASVRGSDPIIRSPHKLGEASATAQLLIGVAASAIENAKNGSRPTSPSISRMPCTTFIRRTSSGRRGASSTLGRSTSTSITPTCAPTVGTSCWRRGLHIRSSLRAT